MAKFHKIMTLACKVCDLQEGLKWLDKCNLTDHTDEEIYNYVSTFIPRPHGALNPIYTNYMKAREYFLNSLESEFLYSIEGNVIFDLCQELYENGYRLTIDKIK